MALRTSTTYLPCTGTLIPQSTIIEWHWDKTDMRYSAEAHQYCSAQPSVFTHIVINADVSTFGFLNSLIKYLTCAVVVAESCFLSSEKKMRHCM